MSKRKFETFSEATCGRSDWLCHPDIKVHVLKHILSPDSLSLAERESVKVLVPGVGHSTIGFELHNLGYDVTVTDLNAEQLSTANLTFPKIRYFDLLQDIPSDVSEKYDYVIDSSVTDVFMQMTSAKVPPVTTAKQVHARLLSCLKIDGIMVVFSMNKNPWKSIYRRFKDRTHRYLRIRPIFTITTQRGRSTSKTGDDVLIFVSTPQGAELALRNVTSEVEGASITDTWLNEVPDDWQSARE